MSPTVDREVATHSTWHEMHMHIELFLEGIGHLADRPVGSPLSRNSCCLIRLLQLLLKRVHYYSSRTCFGSTLFFQSLDVGTCSQIVVRSVLEVTEVARKATGSSAAQRYTSRTRIVKSGFTFVPNFRVGLALVRFFELAVAHALLLGHPCSFLLSPT